LLFHVLLTENGFQITTNSAYPNCDAIDPWRIGDGQCDERYNTVACNYDGADCCPYGDPNDLKLADARYVHIMSTLEFS